MSDSDVVIRVEGLGKKYSLHHEQGERYTALRDVVARQAKAAGRLLNPFTLAGQLRKAQRQAAVERAESEEEFWALKDVSFEIRRGERVGIIGRNGAGKSTLLKILSRITEPTTGRVEIRGRVASLLEVGTGFHPELTGRENIFLNGAILGMTRREIRSKFDEIVDFAEVEKFLDTPVKRYSSGMYVRLAFAVAAHLEPEILVVDEVLAVGDASFQKKCLSKMKDKSSREAVTVLFVSHQLGAIMSLTSRCILLADGKIKKNARTAECVDHYMQEGSCTSGLWKAESHNQKAAQITRIELLNHKNKSSSELDIRYPVKVKIHYEIRDCIRGAVAAINIYAADGAHIVSLEDIDQNEELKTLRDKGSYATEVTMPGMWLNRGTFSIRVTLGIPGGKQFDDIEKISVNLIETGNTITRQHRSGYLLGTSKNRKTA